ncbi:hypothetical protein [Sulfurimonas sp.]|uniref:hypothetical protein n=1 Tax=Sulfurimonas sp. TaxID=2022749 RepID=UPI002636D54A|nr:hypothetical protein [Sulfurimonas sp.]MCW8895343.1 hypothetical protein [Sulfurimonas sp.]
MELDKFIEYLKKFSKYKNQDSGKRIFFDILGAEIPGYIYSSALFTITMNKLGYNIDYQIGNNQGKLKKIYSFNAVNFFTPKKYKILKYLPKMMLLNLINIPNYFSVNKLFNMYIDNVYVGDLIYDSYNRREEQPSIDEINLKYFRKINEAFFYYCYYVDIFKSNKYEYTILNHNCYISNALIGRVSQRFGSKPILLSGDYMGILARKLYPDDAVFNFYSIMNTKLYKESLEREKLVKKAEVFFDNVMNQTVKTHDSVNFEVAKTITDIQERIEVLKYKNSGKKIVVISSHVLIDNIVGSDGRRQTYRDILVWLRETLILCEKNKNIITFLKPHPREYAFKYTPTIIDVYNDLNLKNIKLWPDNLDMKDNHDLIDAIITIRGSVSFEFPGFGIPVILAGKDHAGASGFGIVNEIDKVDEYEKAIANIHNLKKLDDVSIRKSKLIYFMYFNSIFYKLGDELRFKKEDLFKEEYLVTDPKQLPLNPYKDNVADILIEKLEKFEENYKEYLANWVNFLNDDSLTLLGEIQYKERYLSD